MALPKPQLNGDVLAYDENQSVEIDALDTKLDALKIQTPQFYSVNLTGTTSILYENIIPWVSLKNHSSYNLNVALYGSDGSFVALCSAIIVRFNTLIRLVEISNSDKGKMYLTVAGSGNLQVAVSHQYTTVAEARINEIIYK